MQECILRKIRDKFFDALTTKVQKKVPDFSLPKDLGGLPMPPEDMYTGDRHLLVQYIGDKIGAVLCLQKCTNYEDRKTVVKCMKAEIDKPLGKCVSDKLCSDSECKGGFKKTCDAVSTGIQDVIKDANVKLSSFDEDNASSAKLLGELKSCHGENETYKKGDILKVYQSFVNVKKQENSVEKIAKFKALLKDLFNSYFDGDAFCSSQSC
jgi:hypothetical protein